jgi:hypothetical protein
MEPFGFCAILQAGRQGPYRVRKISDYKRHAEECRMLAQTADTAEHRATLLAMAETWLDLAKARETEIARLERVAKLDVKTRAK